MLTITKLKMWKDPGYTRNCADVPPLGSKKLPAADYSSDATLRPRKNSTLTALELPLSYTQMFEMSYLYIEASDGNGSLTLFGWVTSVEQIASSEAAVRITWDVDWWRSFSGEAQLDTGVIVKCPDSAHKRPYRTQPRYWRTTHQYPITGGKVPSGMSLHHLWVYVFVVWNKISNNDVTDIVTQSRILYAPIYSQMKSDSSATAVAGMSIDKLFGGELDEWVNQYASDSNASAKIIGAWLAPFAPENFSFDRQTQIWTGDGSGYTILGSTTITTTPHMCLSTYSSTLDTRWTYTNIAGQCDELNRIAVTDFEGNILGYSPYGLTVTGFKGVLDIGPNGGYVYLRFRFAGEGDLPLTIPEEDNPYGPSAGDEETKKHLAPSLGCGFAIPLPSVPVNENQWSDYMYAGQRDFDITNARIANEKQAISGLESAASSAIGGGVTGASAGPAGAAAGMIGGGALSGVMTGVNYLLGENFNKQLQDATDKLYANQKNGIVLGGGSKSKLLFANCYFPMLILQEPDPISKAEYLSDIAVNGYDTDISVVNVSTFIEGTEGAYRIINLTVGGQIPPQAKQYIKDKLDAGVRIIENNPSGVVP